MLKTYKWSLCKVTEDGGHRVERVELSLQNTEFHLYFKVDSFQNGKHNNFFYWVTFIKLTSPSALN